MREWRTVTGWEGFYEVSNDGFVRSLLRTIMRSNGIPQKIRERLLSRHTIEGYWAVTLNGGGRRESVLVHRLVCTAFHGPAPQNCEVAHGDGDRKNCHESNLRWATRPENIRDKAAHGTQPMGEAVYIAKLTEDQAAHCLRSSESDRRLARQFGVHHSTIWSLRKGKSWKHIRRAA